ncbi:MAG: SMP-30/gluconolactonase/LRE family protein [Chitinophagaceae bacterium]
MQYTTRFLFSCALAFSLPVLGQGLDSISTVQPGAVLVQVSKQFIFTEGPAVDKNGNVYFTDQPNNKIWKYNTEGELVLYMENARRANGMYFDRRGRLIVCADEANQLLSIDADKNIKVLTAGFRGHAFNGPNDLWIDAKGGIYFTDPYYQRDYWTRKKPDLDRQDLYYLAANSKQAVIADSNLLQPNGIVGSADGKYLYVADIRGGKTYRYEIGSKGILLNKTMFVAMGSDGMTTDEKGNLYLTGKGVTIFDPSGNKIGHIPVPAGWVGNLCFGGKDRRTLFITASESVYTLQMHVKGVQ